MYNLTNLTSNNNNFSYHIYNILKIHKEYYQVISTFKLKINMENYIQLRYRLLTFLLSKKLLNKQFFICGT